MSVFPNLRPENGSMIGSGGIVNMTRTISQNKPFSLVKFTRWSLRGAVQKKLLFLAGMSVKGGGHVL